MTYVLPKELSIKFNVSLQTVYNYLKKYEGRIRTKSELNKTFIHLDDFTNFVKGVVNTNTTTTHKSLPEKESNSNQSFDKNFKSLETENKSLVRQTEDLQKYNNNLQDQLSKYALLLTEEKSEKREILGKYEAVQTEYHQKVESLYQEKVKIERKYYLLL